MRTAQRLALQEVADEIGVSKSQLARFETCERDIPSSASLKLSKMLRQPVARLLEELLIDGSGALIPDGYNSSPRKDMVAA